MAEDIAPELLEKIQEEFRKNCSSDKELQEISRKVADGTANCVDLENYAIAAGEMLAKALHNNVSGDILPDGKMYYNIASRILPPNLEECHVMVADIAEGIYGVLNEKAGIHIKAQRPDFNKDRIDGIVDYVSNAEQYEDVRKSTEQSIVNFSQSVATDAVHKNADFQYKAGLSPKIRRSAEGNCCKWCQSLEGTYDYADVRNTGNDVWRRHRDCRCEVTSDPGTGRTQNAHSKTWSWMEENEKKVEDRINNRFNSPKGYDIIKHKKQGVFYSAADPMADAFGPGEESNPEEIKMFRKECAELGVKIIESEKEKLEYQPNPRRGLPGQLCISKNASYSAWLHEMQHVYDDRDSGWDGIERVWDIDEHVAREEKAYGLEIDLAEKLGRPDIAELLRENLETEKRRLYGSQ